MGHLGFSYIGLVFLLMLFIPNLIWAKHQPEGYTAVHENRILVLCERIGQVLTTTCVLIFDDFNLKPWHSWSLWLVLAIGLMILYEMWWIHYFKSPKTLKDFYGRFFGIPFPGATLPVAAFFLLGIYGRVIWLMLATLLLGIGHITIHWNHARSIHEER